MIAERLLFLPGAGGEAAFWRPLAERLQHPAERVLLGWPSVGVRSLDDLYRLVVERMDRPVDLIAQSMGGVLALRAALERPERVRHLVLTAPSGGFDLTRHGAADWRPAWRESRPAEPWWADDRSDFEARLAEIAAPTLLLFGDADPISSVAAGRHLASRLRDAELRVVAAGDHGFARDRAAEIAPHVERHLRRAAGGAG